MPCSGSKTFFLCDCVEAAHASAVITATEFRGRTQASVLAELSAVLPSPCLHARVAPTLVPQLREHRQFNSDSGLFDLPHFSHHVVELSVGGSDELRRAVVTLNPAGFLRCSICRNRQKECQHVLKAFKELQGRSGFALQKPEAPAVLMDEDESDGDLSDNGEEPAEVKVPARNIPLTFRAPQMLPTVCVYRPAECLCGFNVICSCAVLCECGGLLKPCRVGQVRLCYCCTL
jgi:hypothetical protein